jgi:hypothetical protein
MQQLPVLEQAVFDQQPQARVGAALAHAKAHAHVLCRGRAHTADEAHDLLVACGLHMGVSVEGGSGPPSHFGLAGSS